MLAPRLAASRPPWRQPPTLFPHSEGGDGGEGGRSPAQPPPTPPPGPHGPPRAPAALSPAHTLEDPLQALSRGPGCPMSFP